MAPADPLALARALLAERQRSAIAPALDLLHRLEATAAPDARVTALCEVLEATSGFMTELARLEPADLASRIAARPGKKKKKKK